MDNVEARLQDLAQVAEERLAGQALVPRSDVARRGHIRRAGTFVGSAVLVAVLAVGGYAGASAIRGGAQLQPADSNVLMAAAETTELEDTARAAFAMEVSYDMAGATSRQRFEGAGELSFVDDMSHFVMQLDGEGEPQLMQEIVQDGPDVYTKDSSSDGWSKVELEEPRSTTFASTEMRPEELLDHLSDVTGGIEMVGEEEIDGEPVTHYVGEFDIDSLRNDLSQEERSALAMYDTDFEPVHVWVDDRGRVRKMSFVVQISMENDGQSFDMSMSYEMSLFAFGEPVDIEIPDESEVVESSSVDGDTSMSDVIGESVGGEVSEETVELQEPDSTPVEEADSVAFAGAGGPYFSVHVYEGPKEICIGNVPEWAWKAGIYREGEDSPLFEFGSDDFDSWDVGPEDDTKAGCIFERVRGLSDLEANATDLIIRMESDARTQDVPIVATERF